MAQDTNSPTPRLPLAPHQIEELIDGYFLGKRLYYATTLPRIGYLLSIGILSHSLLRCANYSSAMSRSLFPLS